MTVAFADASALVKRYVDEEGSDLVLAFEGPVVLSELSRVEVASALWRKHRLGELTASDASLLVAAWSADLAGTAGAPWARVAVTSTLLTDAARLVARHDLRTGDAVQLATALRSRSAVPDCRTMLVFDRRLRDAAAREGFTLLPNTN